MRAVKSVSIDSERRVIITYLDGSTETLYPNCIWCDSAALRQLIKDLLEEKADAITQTIENVTIATFNDGADEGLIKKLLVSIEPIQEGSGDPSPDNVRPISGRSGMTLYHSRADTSDPSAISVNWNSEVGTVYGGNLDVVTGKLSVDRAVIIFDGSETWNTATTDPSTNAYRFRTSLPDMLFGTGVNGTQLCDKLMPTTGNTGSGSSSIITGNPKSITLLSNQAVAYINAGGLISEDSVMAFKEWLSINKPTLCYKLAEPVEYQLVPQEITTLLGTNNIWCDSGNILELEYTADTKLYIGESQVGRTSSAQQSINKPVEFDSSIIKPVTEVTEKEQIEEEE